MPKTDVNCYFVRVRTSKSNNYLTTLHINACSYVGAIYQATILLKQNKVEEIYSITVSSKYFPVAKQKLKKYLRGKKRKTIPKKSISCNIKI